MYYTTYHETETIKSPLYAGRVSRHIAGVYLLWRMSRNYITRVYRPVPVLSSASITKFVTYAVCKRSVYI